jgi:chromosome segregation ATPase
MCLSRYLDEMSSQLSSFLGYEDGNRWVLETIDRLEKRIHRYKVKLRNMRAALAGLEQRINEKKQRIERLTNRVEVYLHLRDHTNAWQYAMTLDQLHQLVEEETSQYRQTRQSIDRLKSGKRHFQLKLASFLATFYSNR